MSDRVALFAILLVVPLVAWGIAYKIETKMEAAWRAAVQSEIADGDTKTRLSAMTLRRYCREVEESRELPVCQWYPAVHLMQRGSILAISLGIALVLAVYLMGRVARGSRNRLALVFKPGLYITLTAPDRIGRPMPGAPTGYASAAQDEA
jgi:hypothetical protein